MSRTQVVQLLGQPDGVKQYGEFEALTTMHSNAADRADYLVILRGGRVVEYGVVEALAAAHAWSGAGPHGVTRTMEPLAGRA